MAQIIEVKKGTNVKKIKIIRTYLDSSGKAVYLHADGRYALKDGTPLKSAADLDIIGNPVHREAALRWWKFNGEAESEAYYQTQTQKERDLVGDFQTESLMSESELDVITYVRRDSTKKKTAVSAPHTWMEWFDRRPDWWGQADSIRFKDYEYTMVTPEDLASLEQNTDTENTVTDLTQPGAQAPM